jgi:hypothetical protein
MSHVDVIEMELLDLDGLGKAASFLGMELVKQDHYRWFGKHMGDYPVPAGFTKQDLGKCEHVLRIKSNSSAYEVGITRRKDGQPGYVMLWDFWAGGMGLQEAIGKDACKLRREYAIQVGMKRAAREGWRVERRFNQTTQKPQMRAWRSR